MEGFIKNAGQYRNRSVDIAKEAETEQLAPPFENAQYFSKDLF